jgi:hypothetical protein
MACKTGPSHARTYHTCQAVYAVPQLTGAWKLQSSPPTTDCLAHAPAPLTDPLFAPPTHHPNAHTNAHPRTDPIYDSIGTVNISSGFVGLLSVAQVCTTTLLYYTIILKCHYTTITTLLIN